MKNYLRATLVFIAIGAIVGLIFLSTLPASAHRPCKIIRNRDGQSVTVSRGPCYRHDFPKNCKVPAKITQGQKIRCPKGK